MDSSHGADNLASPHCSAVQQCRPIDSLTQSECVTSMSAAVDVGRSVIDMLLPSL